ncbi:MAG: glycoside hydrolase family protein [Smithella sp.]
MTIGVGHNFDDNPLPNDIKKSLEQFGKIDDEQIDRLLNRDIRSAVHDCQVLFPSFNEFSDNRRMALIDWMFQLGFRGVRNFKKAVKAINAEEWELAARNMAESAWAREQTPKRAKEVIELIRVG